MRCFSSDHGSAPLRSQTAASERQAFVILNTLFAWLVNAGYLAGNPLSLSRQRARKAKPRVTRFLEDDLWQAVKTSIDAMARDTAGEQEHYARVRWLISILYLKGLRISEVVSNPMGDFLDGAIAKARIDGGWRSPGKATRNVCFQ